MFINEYPILQEPDFHQSLQHIVEDWGSFRMYSDEFRSKISNFLEIPRRIGEECQSFLIFFEKYLFSEESDPLETWKWIEKEWGLSSLPTEKYLSSLDGFKFLKRDFKFLDIILNLHVCEYGTDAINKVQRLFQGAAADLVQIYSGKVRPWSHHFHDYVSDLQHKFWNTKTEIRRAKPNFYEGSLRLLANKDGIVIFKFVMEYIETVADNLSDLLKLNDPNSPLMGQIEKALKELKFLNRLVCFVSDRCIKPFVLHTFFSHVVEVAWHTIMVIWLYLPSYECGDEEHSLFSNLIHGKFQSIHKIYNVVLRASKLVQSQWYPVIQIKYVVDCGVRFLETLLYNLEELPISNNCKETKAILQEMCNFLRVNLINLPIQVTELHLQDVDSVIVDAGLLVYSLTDSEKADHDFPGKIQSMQAVIYIIIRKIFLLQLNLPGIDGVGSAKFILDNREMFQSLYSNSVDSVKSQLQKVQKELKCFQAVVEQQDGLQHFVTQTNGLVYEVEYIFDSCKKKDVPDWYLFLWILNVGEDIRVLMAEVAELQETNVFDLVSHNTTNTYNADTSSQFATNTSMNEEMVGRNDVMDKLRRKLTEGSSNLDVISISGMPGVGKTTLANKLYFDESIVSHFDIRAKTCVSQKYNQKNVLLTILSDLIGKNAKLDKEAENALRVMLRKKLFQGRYLIFIDDIWHTSAWDDLHMCFPDNNNGSRIILTTRHRDVASYATLVSDPLDLQFLSNDESWMLLKKKVFNEEICPLDLQDVGERITKKCSGLPLSVVLVAGILTRMDKKEHYWEQVAASIGPHIQDQSKGTIDLSYQNLPNHLRPCFLYFGVFSEGREIKVSKLTWLWISEGFVTTQTEKSLEDIANDYLENLVGRNLITVAKKSFDGKIKACCIHDLLLEFCRRKAKQENFLESVKGDIAFDPSHVFPPKYRTPRRLSLHSQCNNLEKWCLSFSHVKSFQFWEDRNIAVSLIDHASFLFKRFKFLRVLDLEFTIIDFLPQELTLLRYLAFRTANDTLSLPANLWNLETLIVQGLGGRVSVPDTIWEMVKLRHLHIYDQAFFTLNKEEGFSESSSKMDDLQTISSVCFSCVENADKILEKTPNLRKLRCEVSKLDGSFPAFSKLKKLEMLKISSGSTLTWINNLKFPSYLKKLTLSNFCINLNEVTTLSNLEVEVLKLLGVTISSNTWKVKDEQFSKLKFLKLENPSFSEWDVSDGAFPCLEHLVLKRCRHLKVIPSCFGYMPSLKSIEVNSCKESLAESAILIKGMQVEEIGYSGFEVFIHNLNNDTPLPRP